MNARTLILPLVGALAAPAMAGETLFSTTADNRLVSFDAFNPGSLLSDKPISGLKSGESILGIDFRPINNRMYALGSSSTLYTINWVTGKAKAVGPMLNPMLSGDSFGFDFNPTVDRIRIVSDADQNLRAHPDTGMIAATDGMLSYAAGDVNAGSNPNVVGAGYTNSFPGAQSTTLYVLDSAKDVLAIQNPPNNGTLNTVGSFGADLSGLVGFDISGSSGIAYVSILDVGGVSSLWTVNLMTGAGIRVGTIGTGDGVTTLAVVPAPASGLALTGLLCAARRRRR